VGVSNLIFFTQLFGIDDLACALGLAPVFFFKKILTCGEILIFVK